MKHLNATKCKDGYIVELSQIIEVVDKKDVYVLMELYGVKIQKEFCNKIRIYAEEVKEAK